jgi:hypothetical protein
MTSIEDLRQEDVYGREGKFAATSRYCELAYTECLYWHLRNLHRAQGCDESLLTLSAGSNLLHGTACDMPNLQSSHFLLGPLDLGSFFCFARTSVAMLRKKDRF